MKVFDKIYEKNSWGSDESRSGPGSTEKQTRKIREALPKIFKDYNIKSMLDVPCGDWNWMKDVDLTGVQYIGGDIVKSVVEHNKIYEKENVKFMQIDLCETALPSADILFVRDCFVHLSTEDIRRALDNIKKSQFRYLLTTTFPLTNVNENIKTGSWRPINIMHEPFSLGEPLLLINEEKKRTHTDKSMGLWKL